MLFVYKPNEQTEETALTIRKVLKKYGCYPNPSNLHFKCEDGVSQLSFTTSWCRELTTNAFNEWVRFLPPGRLDIFGIRRHGDSWGSQPVSAIGRIDKADRTVNLLFHNLFQFMTEMVSHIFDTHSTELHSIKFWLNTLACSVPPRVDLKHTIRCLLNCDPNLIPDTPLWKTDKMYGTIFNIPSEWLCSSAVMSYLLYLPRVWGAFYAEPQVLKRLIGAGRLNANTKHIAELCDSYTRGAIDPVGDDVKLWRFIARRFMLPLWFTKFGKQDFWEFTYLLIREGVAVKKGLTRVPGLLEALDSNKCSGFMSWLRNYRRRPEMSAPDWVRKLYTFLEESGPIALLLLRPLVAHV